MTVLEHPRPSNSRRRAERRAETGRQTGLSPLSAQLLASLTNIHTRNGRAVNGMQSGPRLGESRYGVRAWAGATPVLGVTGDSPAAQTLASADGFRRPSEVAPAHALFIQLAFNRPEKHPAIRRQQ